MIGLGVGYIYQNISRLVVVEGRDMNEVTGVMNTAFFRTWKKVLLSPSEFYSSMPISGGYVEPFKFAFICVSPIMVMNILVSIYEGSLFSLITIPVIYVVGLFSTLVLESFLVMIASFIFARTENKGFESIFRIFSYSSILGSIPFVGITYSMILAIIGIREVFRVSTARASILVSGVIIFYLGGLTVAIYLILVIYSMIMNPL